MTLVSDELELELELVDFFALGLLFPGGSQWEISASKIVRLDSHYNLFYLCELANLEALER